MLKRIFALLLLLACLLPLPANAQADIRLSTVGIDLWPEYDRPTMLVIYHVTLSPTVPLPAELVFRIPADAGEPNAVAVSQPNGDLFNTNYERQVQGEWALIRLTATTLDVRLEYYDPNLTKQGSDRRFAYQWPGDYAVDLMVIQVQQPIGATDMRISPDLGSGQARTDGLTYYTSEVGSLSAGQTFELTLNYQKENDSPSVTNLRVEPSAPITGEISGRMNPMTALPWLLGILGVVLIVGGGWWYWQSGREKGGSQPRRRRRASAKPEVAQTEEVHIYCHQCGKRAGPGDRFCRTCGTQLRLN